MPEVEEVEKVKTARRRQITWERKRELEKLEKQQQVERPPRDKLLVARRRNDGSKPGCCPKNWDEFLIRKIENEKRERLMPPPTGVKKQKKT